MSAACKIDVIFLTVRLKRALRRHKTFLPSAGTLGRISVGVEEAVPVGRDSTHRGFSRCNISCHSREGAVYWWFQCWVRLFEHTTHSDHKIAADFQSTPRKLFSPWHVQRSISCAALPSPPCC